MFQAPPRIGERQRVDNHPNLSLLPTLKCGKSFVQKIWGGSETGLGEYPWMALLGYRSCNQLHIPSYQPLFALFD